MELKKIKTRLFRQKKLFIIVNFILLFILVLFLGINQILIIKINKALGIGQGTLSQVGAVIFNKANSSSLARIELTGDIGQDVIKLVISNGAPEIYGQALGVSFDSVQQSINIMRQYDPTYGDSKIILKGDGLERYTNIGLRISCEYCCSAKSIVFSDGKAACGCAHSQAMRGLAAYLIKNYDSEFSNDEILRELARWKGMFFPKQMIKKMASQLQNGSYTPDTASLAIGLKLPDYGKGSKDAPLPSEIENLPSMVGGC